MKSTHWMGALLNKCATTSVGTSTLVKIGTAFLGQDCGKVTYYNGSSSVIGLYAGPTTTLATQVCTIYPGINSQGLECVIPQKANIYLLALDVAASTGSVQVDFFT